MRMLGMRRTLFVVPRELVPVVYAACTRTIAARERRRLEKMILDSGISSRPSSLAHPRPVDSAESARGARRSIHVGSHEGRPGSLEATPLRHGLEIRGDPERRLACASAARDGGPDRPRVVLAEPGSAVSTAGCPWMSGWTARSEKIEQGEAQATLLRRWLAAFGPATETDIRWWAGWTAREARAALASTPHAVVDLEGGATGYVLTDDLEPAKRLAPSAALLPTLDPTTMGWKERNWYLGEHAVRSSSTRTATLARPCGGTAASSGAGRSDATARSFSCCSRTWDEKRLRRWRPRLRVSRPGSVTSASRRASCRPFSASWRPD